MEAFLSTRPNLHDTGKNEETVTPSSLRKVTFKVELKPLVVGCVARCYTTT